LLKKQTQPPKYYTEGTLLRAMETAGKLVEDDELRDAMKENGIGRPSTRAAIIETLFKRHYIRKVKKNLQATQAGISLIDTINEELLKSAKLTGLWENKLRKIERDEYAAADFISELKEMVSKIVIDVLKDNSHNSIPVDDDKDNKKKPKK
jgi:DNA topoisomerase-3